MKDPRGIALAVAVIAIRRSRGLALRAKTPGHNGAGLRQKCGPEYDRAVLAGGSKAEEKFADREKQIQALNIRDLDPTEHDAI